VQKAGEGIGGIRLSFSSLLSLLSLSLGEGIGCLRFSFSSSSSLFSPFSVLLFSSYEHFVAHLFIQLILFLFILSPL
jgi:hypothetical protein